ncbi:hypothetical protein ACHAQJ_000408 [Trichoderma viride]
MASSPGIDFVEVYTVSREAPEEFRGLSQELGNLYNTIQLSTGELEDKDSTLSQSRDVRISTMNRLMLQSEEALKNMHWTQNPDRVDKYLFTNSRV